jgi:hypothetical protein
MKRLLLSVLMLSFAFAAFAGSADKEKKRVLPTLIVNARYVYVTSYDGDLPNGRVSPEDLRAIATVQDALQAWGRYKIAYRASDAELIVVVHTSRPYLATGKWEDELAVYDARSGMDSNPLWRQMVDDGLQGPDPQLIRQFREAVEEAARELPQGRQSYKH